MPCRDSDDISGIKRSETHFLHVIAQTKDMLDGKPIVITIVKPI